MSEHRPRTWFDQFTIVRELRAGCHALAFKIMTGEEPKTAHGWQRSTCLEQYDELDAIGRFAVRFMPTSFGFFLAAFVLNLPLRSPQGVFWVPVLYFVACWVALVGYDLVAGLPELRRGVGEVVGR